MQRPVIASYILAAVSVVVVLGFHLLPAVFAGLAVHILTLRLARRLPRHVGKVAHKVALAFIVTCIICALTGTGFAAWFFVKSEYGISGLLAAIAETLEKIKHSLPDYMAGSVPATVEEMRGHIVELIREHRQKISAVGREWFRFLAHVLIGTVIGGMTALHRFTDTTARIPLAGALRERLANLVDAFDKIVFAQIKISGLNAFLTAVYLFGLLPLFHVRMPLRTILVIFTFVAGLLPVIGNLISNTVVVLIGLGVSPAVGAASLGFLILIHKLEYFTNAKIVGGEVHASAWELLAAMVGLEALFGLPGLVAAPVVYAWLKTEVEAAAIPEIPPRGIEHEKGMTT